MQATIRRWHDAAQAFAIPAGRKRAAALVLLALWLGVMSIVTLTFMVSHWYTLPKPDNERPLVAASIAGLRTADDRGRWMAVHVLYADCGCSRRIFSHLFAGDRPAGVTEKVVLVGDAPDLEKQAAAAGFAVEAISPGQLRERFHVQAAPLLLIADPGGKLRYVGGYTERKRGPDPKDKEILARLMTDHAPSELPLFGCAVSASLQQLLDPIGIKYRDGDIR